MKKFHSSIVSDIFCPFFLSLVKLGSVTLVEIELDLELFVGSIKNLFRNLLYHFQFN